MFFELDDIKRRHSLYYDIYNVGGWVRTPDASASWNYQRGAIVGVAAALVTEGLNHFAESWRLLLRHYEPPSSFKQLGIFTRETLKLENFRRGVKNRFQYGVTIGATDIAARVALFRWANQGWQLPWGGFEYNFMRKIPGTFFAALVSAPVSIPFELARMAYYADKTFPKELQKGYSSYLNALRRIPFEEGPYYLFKNSFPFFLRNFFQTFTLFYTYDFIKDKVSLMWRHNDIPYLPSIMGVALFSTYLACAFSYPWAVTVRDMVEYWPKDAHGKSHFDNNYRKAAVWLYYHDFTSNLYPGFFTNYFWRNAPWMFLTLMWSDYMGIFTYWRVDYFSGPGTNSWEDSFA